jgi:hypothetical protein
MLLSFSWYAKFFLMLFTLCSACHLFCARWVYQVSLPAWQWNLTTFLIQNTILGLDTLEGGLNI